MPCPNFDLPVDQLEALYLSRGPRAPTIYRANSAVDLLLDGIDYLSQLNSAIELTTGAGDFVYILAWRFDPMVNLRSPARPAKHLGQILAEKASQGVDVRIIISGHAWVGRAYVAWIPLDTISAVEQLRNITTVSGSMPLSNRVLLDSTAHALGGSHHQKASVIKHGNEVVAFVGGIDPWQNRLDQQPHNTMNNGGTVWGWHDMGVKVRGLAVADVWMNFKERWIDAATATPRNYAIYDIAGPEYLVGEPVISWKPHNPSDINQHVPALISPDAVPSSSSVQILRSRYPRKEAGTNKERMWASPTSGGYTEVLDTYREAIRNAQCYIYMEDQYFADKWRVFAELPDWASLFPLLVQAVRRGVRVILVGGAISDPDPPPQLSINQTVDDFGDCQEKLLHHLSPEGLKNIALNRIEHTFIHSKLVIIDDCFAAIGSANMHSRSMYGLDSELQVGIVGGSTVRNFRMQIWQEHIRMGPASASTEFSAALSNLDTALGIWRKDWLNPPSDMWRVPDNPVGFLPSETAITYVGP